MSEAAVPESPPLLQPLQVFSTKRQLQRVLHAAPILALPFVWLFLRFASVPNVHLARTAIVTGTIGVLLLAAYQTIVALGLAHLLFSKPHFKDLISEMQKTDTEKRRRPDLVHNHTYALYVLLNVFLSVGVGEELLKYAAIRLSLQWHPTDSLEVYLAYAVSGATGLAVAENIGFLYATRSYFWLVVVERTVISNVHVGSALIIARRLHQEASLFKTLGLAIVLHASIDLVLVTSSTIDGYIAFQHPAPGKKLAVLYLFMSIMSLVIWSSWAQGF